MFFRLKRETTSGSDMSPSEEYDEYLRAYGFDAEDQDYDNDISDDDTRIVNGYSAGKRPWIVFINVTGGACGGALINHK